MNENLCVYTESLNSQLESYIACMIGAGTGLCCLFGFCFFCNRRRRDDEEYTEEHGNIVVNVDVEDVQRTENHLHSKCEGHEEFHDETDESHSSSDRHTSLRRGELVKPTDDDVCFGESRHQGTKECREALRKYIKKNPDESYGPDVFKAVRRKLSDRQLLTRDSTKTKKWRKATKSEAISSIGEMWRELKYKGK